MNPITVSSGGQTATFDPTQGTSDVFYTVTFTKTNESSDPEPFKGVFNMGASPPQFPKQSLMVVKPLHFHCTATHMQKVNHRKAFMHVKINQNQYYGQERFNDKGVVKNKTAQTVCVATGKAGILGALGQNSTDQTTYSASSVANNKAYFTWSYDAGDQACVMPSLFGHQGLQIELCDAPGDPFNVGGAALTPPQYAPENAVNWSLTLALIPEQSSQANKQALPLDSSNFRIQPFAAQTS